MTFYNTLLQTNWNKVKESIFEKTSGDVEFALANQRPTLEDFDFTCCNTIS